MVRILSFLLVMMSMAGAAEASVFVWKDDVNGFSISFPDEWTLQTKDVPSTQLRIASPAGEDFATCRVQAQKDGRLKIYPHRLMGEAVHATLDRVFWENEASQYTNATVTDYIAPEKNNNEVDTTAVKVSFEEKGNGKMQMSGTMIGSIYGDMRYVVSCSSRKEVYATYAPQFADIIASVRLDTRYAPFPTGYYRNFLADPKPNIPHIQWSPDSPK